MPQVQHQYLEPSTSSHLQTSPLIIFAQYISLILLKIVPFSFFHLFVGGCILHSITPAAEVTLNSSLSILCLMSAQPSSTVPELSLHVHIYIYTHFIFSGPQDVRLCVYEYMCLLHCPTFDCLVYLRWRDASFCFFVFVLFLQSCGKP